ncbi:SCO4402 family protein [Crossiella cryophila]|uniref:Uncharacterized protein n=1 Tax=Crossiella cryophila TaxID=43355 RepID=A0A7W7CF27_9PSEU|nr:hypothetical protein [Crossiella cryophila]MBB4679991.1 hypothetical protein [Crossiella cryophila]
MRQVRFPGLRFQVLAAVRALADREYQERVWLDLSNVETLDECVHVLFDDTEVLSDPASSVGEILHANEVEPLRQAGLVFDALITDLGDVRDEVYLADPRWPGVLAKAEAAWAVMTANEAVLPVDLSG